MNSFTGEITHSDSFHSKKFEGKKTLVFGAGVSAHELVHDLWEHGVDDTMLQRSATYVVTFETNHRLWNPLFTEDMVYSQEFADQIAYAIPNERTNPINKRLVKLGAEMKDAALIVFATGYHQFWGQIKAMHGNAASKIDKAYGRAADGEYANTWRRSAQPESVDRDASR